MTQNKSFITEEDYKVFKILDEISEEYILFPTEFSEFETNPIYFQESFNLIQRHDFSTPLDLIITKGKENALME